jgi:hypothetical protein
MRFFELRESTYHVKNNSVYGKVLAQDGQTVVTDHDTAQALADRYNGSLIKAMDGKRYIIKLSEAPPHVVGESIHREPFSDPVAVLKHKLDRMEQADSDQIDLVMKRIANRQGISAEQLHKMWTDKYQESPDEYCGISDKMAEANLPTGIRIPMTPHGAFNPNDPGILQGIPQGAKDRLLQPFDKNYINPDSRNIKDPAVRGYNKGQMRQMYGPGSEKTIRPISYSDDDDNVEENFKDGKGPGRPGDAKRHGVPTKASVSSLRKVAKQGGRKGQLAHWMANMKAGKKKADKK